VSANDEDAIAEMLAGMDAFTPAEEAVIERELNRVMNAYSPRLAAALGRVLTATAEQVLRQ
jgi:hypothetical protein